MGEHIDWALLRPEMAAGMGKLSGAVYGNSQLSVREREAARWTIALINDCAVCRDTRARDGEAVGAGEPFYAEVTDWRAATGLSALERLAAEFAERFALDHLAMDDALVGPPARGLHRGRAGGPHHLLRLLSRPGPGDGRGRRAGPRGAHPRLSRRPLPAQSRMLRAVGFRQRGPRRASSISARMAGLVAGSVLPPSLPFYL